MLTAKNTVPEASPRSTDPRAEALVERLAAGGDERLALDPESGLNRYMTAPYPRDVLAFASSTANDLSPEAFAYLLEREAVGDSEYAAALDAMRARLRSAYALSDAVGIVFSPSGTDLEYVALAAVQGLGRGGVHNILLGADEVGRGCILSAAGQYFSQHTALGGTVPVGEAVPGFDPVSLVDIPVRCGEGLALTSAEIAAAIADQLEAAQADGKHALVHVVHGSKTGLVLPKLTDVDSLRARWGAGVSWVVDACQARITSAEIAAYLERDMIVLLTGSKFIGGAPFSGFALVPATMIAQAPPLAEGLRALFRRAEWPRRWAGGDGFADSANPGLAARIDASLYELERFQALSATEVAGVIAAFQEAVDETLVRPLGLKPIITSAAETGQAPDLLRTLVTLDVSSLPAAHTFDDSVALHIRLARGGIRLGQPVKSVRLPEGGWGGTLRIGLAMPQVVEVAALEPDRRKAWFEDRLARVARALATPAADPDRGNRS